MPPSLALRTVLESAEKAGREPFAAVVRTSVLDNAEAEVKARDDAVVDAN